MKIARCLLAMAIAFGIGSMVRADHHKKSLDLVGVWNATAETDANSREIKWTFKNDGDKLTGVSFDQENGDVRDLDRVLVNENKVTLEVDIEMDGNTGIIRVEAEAKTPSKLVGKWSVVDDGGTEYMSGDISAVKDVAFAGSWNAKAVMTDGSNLESVVKLSGKNSSLNGSIDGAAGTLDIDKASVNDGELRLEFDFEMDGNQINARVECESHGNDKLVGRWVVVDSSGFEVAEGEWSAQREAQGLAGVWNVVAAVPDSDDYIGTITLNAAGGKYTGTSTTRDGAATQLRSVTVDGGQLEYQVPFERDGYTGTITVTAKQGDDGSLEGEWALTGDDGNEYARETWKASRQ